MDASYTRVIETESLTPSASTCRWKKRNMVFMKCKKHNPITEKGDTWKVKNSELNAIVIQCN